MDKLYMYRDFEEVAVEIGAKSGDQISNSAPDSPASMGSSGAISETIDVPDRMVGLSRFFP